MSSTPAGADTSKSEQRETHFVDDIIADTLHMHSKANNLISSNATQKESSQLMHENNEVGGLGISLMLSSPPPHSYRHSRAYRHFKNPPQPHMCIRTKTEAGEELFINVLSWTRIVIPQEPSDPIPLYGGMRVPPGNPRSPPIVFAVMANPEVLKDSGRHSKDPEERRAMVELMCDFVEAMNPGVKLLRNAFILKDRDISGELKDVWNAVQAQRDREREEQMLQQRQQQHYQNITTQQMFPKTAATDKQTTLLSGNDSHIANADINSLPIVLSTKDEQHLDKKSITGQQVFAEDNELKHDALTNTTGILITTASDTDSENLNNSNSEDQCDAVANNILKEQYNKNDLLHNFNTTQSDNPADKTNPIPIPTSLSTNFAELAVVTTTTTKMPISPSSTNNANSPTSTVTPPPKKDKLGGFLPNGCIFPRFKNNKHKDKDNQKETKGKEKTLLNALKKSKEKKAAPCDKSEKIEKTPAMNATPDAATQYEKNCMNNLESEVQKLDLSKIDSTPSNESMFIKLKVSPSSAAAK